MSARSGFLIQQAPVWRPRLETILPEKSRCGFGQPKEKDPAPHAETDCWKKCGPTLPHIIPKSGPCCFDGYLRAFADRSDALFEHINGDVRFFLGDDKRRAKPDRARPAAKEQDATFERQLDNAVALGGTVFLAQLVLNDLDADHQAAPAHIADQLQLRRPVRHALLDVIAYIGRVLEEMFLLDHAESSQCRSHRDWIAAKGRSVRAGNPVHNLRARHRDAQRHS